jgi:hypothetical protein
MSKTEPKNGQGSIPKTWEEVKVGSLVIAHESVEDGWWEAIVLAVYPDRLTVRWRDFPKQSTVQRTKSQIALLVNP